jgi:hypothetical protein
MGEVVQAVILPLLRALLEHPILVAVLVDTIPEPLPELADPALLSFGIRFDCLGWGDDRRMGGH